MRILALDDDKGIKEAIIYLKINEAKELLGALKQLILKNDLSQHYHISDSAYKHEITVVLYDEKNINMLNKRSQKLIEEDL